MVFCSSRRFVVQHTRQPARRVQLRLVLGGAGCASCRVRAQFVAAIPSLDNKARPCRVAWHEKRALSFIVCLLCRDPVPPFISP